MLDPHYDLIYLSRTYLWKKNVIHSDKVRFSVLLLLSRDELSVQCSAWTNMEGNYCPCVPMMTTSPSLPKYGYGHIWAMMSPLSPPFPFYS